MIWLVDGNIMVAYAVDTHLQHQRAACWFDALTESFATCSVTQGTLLRLHMKFAADQSAKAAWNSLKGFESHPLHVYWPDDLPYSDVPHRHIQGHRQVTDAWIIELAKRNNGKVATLDQGMVATYPETAVLI